VWVGYSYGGAAGTTRKPFFLKVQRGYTPSPLPRLEKDVMEVSATGQDLSAADADALIAIAQSGAAVPTTNHAAQYARSYSPTDYSSMLRTNGASIAVMVDRTDAHVFLRASGAKLLYVDTGSKPVAVEMWKLQ